MNIVFPVTVADIESAQLCPVEEATAFAVIEIDENATIVEINFSDTQKQACNEADVFVVVRGDKEQEFLYEYPIKALIAPLEYSIDDVIEGYQFRELHEIV